MYAAGVVSALKVKMESEAGYGGFLESSITLFHRQQELALFSLDLQ